MKSKVLQLLKLKVSDLKEFQGDFKKLSKKQFEKLKLSIQNNGFIQPFFVWQKENNFFILDGHQRKKAIIDLYGNDLQVDCLQVEAESELEAKKFVIFYSSSYGEFTKESFFNFAKDLNFKDIEPFHFPTFSFSEKDFLNDSNSEPDDHIPDVVENECGVKTGDIWQLGDHKLMCGDCTDLKLVETLMAGTTVDMVFTDPPYGVSYTKKNEFLNSLGNGYRLTKAIKNDENSTKDMFDLWKSIFKITATFSTEEASYYICSPQVGELMMMMMMAIDQSPWSLKHTIVWVKNNHVLGRCDYHYQHEPILYGWKKKGKHHFFGNGNHTKSVWNINKPNNSDLHPTMKPIELIENALLNSTKKDSKVLDVFGGSGSTLIACEKLNRKCFMMEIDPHYCSVIIKRWENFTGKKAVKL